MQAREKAQMKRTQSARTVLEPVQSVDSVKDLTQELVTKLEMTPRAPTMTAAERQLLLFDQIDSNFLQAVNIKSKTKVCESSIP